MREDMKLRLHMRLLFGLLLSWGCTAGPQGGKAQQLGTPLSDQEYRQFFRSLRTARRASTACILRALYGCQNPLVRRLDEYENHGAIPEVTPCHPASSVPSPFSPCLPQPPSQAAPALTQK
uniref:Acrosin-binding protein n=1 Tax=Accipiter nisus TaxID=211598 RepID=A0A8B9RVM5_9AVES